MRMQAMAWLLALVQHTRLYDMRRAMGMGNSGEEQPKRRSVAGVRACTSHRQSSRVWRGVLMASVGPQHGLWGCAIARSVCVRHTGRGARCGVEC